LSSLNLSSFNRFLFFICVFISGFVVGVGENFFYTLAGVVGERLFPLHLWGTLKDNCSFGLEQYFIILGAKPFSNVVSFCPFNPFLTYVKAEGMSTTYSKIMTFEQSPSI